MTIYYVLLHVTIFYSLLLSTTIYYNILLYLTIYDYILLCPTIWYYKPKETLVKPIQTNKNQRKPKENQSKHAKT